MKSSRFALRILGRAAVMALWLCGAIALTPAFAVSPDDLPGRVGRLSVVEGAVWRFSPDENQWVSAERNRPLTTGDRLSTDASARAEWRVGSSVVRLDSGTEIALLRLDDAHLQLQLQRGSVVVRLRDNDRASEFELLTAEGSFRTGSLGQDAQSPAGYARTASVMNGDAAEYLFYGPFRAFSKDGTYIACFSLKSSENTSPAPTATIDVYDHPGLFPTDCTLGSAVIKGTDFRQAGEYQWFFVPFEWNRNDGGFVEFRVFWHGTSDLALDQIVVFGINR